MSAKRNRQNYTKGFIQDAEQAVNGQQDSSELKAEIRRLKKENQRLQMEREILKKGGRLCAMKAA